MDHVIAFTDLQLVRQALQKPELVDQVLRRLCPVVHRVVKLVARSSAEADDLTQLALLQIVKHLDSFRGEGSLDAWAGRIAYRLAIREIRKKAASPLLALEDVGERVFEKSRQSPEKYAKRRQLWRQLSAHMDRIPENRRSTLLLHLLQGYTISETAELTAVSVNTAKDRLKTAYRELRAILTHYPALAEAMQEALDD